MPEYVTSKSGLSEDQKEKLVDLVICMKVADIPTPAVPSNKEVCKGCGADIWVSPNSPKTPPKYCLPCVAAIDESQQATKQ